MKKVETIKKEAVFFSFYLKLYLDPQSFQFKTNFAICTK